MEITEDEIKNDPDSILEDEEKIKAVVKDHELVVKVLEAKEETEMKVTVDGEEVALVRPFMSAEELEKRKIPFL